MIEMHSTKIIFMYGLTNYPCFLKVKDMEIKIIQYKSFTNRRFNGGNSNGKWL